MNVKNADNPLGYEKISKLLLKFAVPSVVAMLVGSLYNIVDQIFIGHYVGPLGNAATNIAFPITTICIAISVLIGVGGASRFSIELGRGNKSESAKTVGTALWTAFGLSVTYAVLAFVFCKELLLLFGATEQTLGFTYQYTSIIIFGIPFLVLTNVLSNFIRADGSPKFSMICMLIGGVTNIILDAVFVPLGGYEYGMAGAAIATVISQVISFISAVLYLKKFKSVNLDKKSFRFRPKKALNIAALGMSNCFNQLAICLVQIVLNNQLKTYGALTEYGPDIPIAAFGIVMKVNSILISFFVGMCQGSQPIVGYNYGARQFDRAKQTCLLASKICMAFSFVGFLAFQFCPQYIVAVFGSGDALYEEFAATTMRTFLFMIVLNGVQMIISNYFSAIGKPLKGVLLSLTRQILLIVPLMIILPMLFGLKGILYAGPITDFVAFLFALTLALVEFRRSEYKEDKKKSDA